MSGGIETRRFWVVLAGIVLAAGDVFGADPAAKGPRLETDFECGAGKRLSQLAPDHWRVETSGDPSFYTKYFCVRVTPGPAGSPTKIRLDVYSDREFGERGRAYFASHFPSYIWSRTGDWPSRSARVGSKAPSLMQGVWGAGETWVPLQNPRPGSVAFHDEFVELHLDLSAGKPIYVASNPPYRYSDLVRWCQAVAAAYPGRAEVTRLGETPEGREIPLIRVRGAKARTRLLVVAGQHPSEHGGVWAAKGLVEYALSAVAEARELAEGLDLAVVPMMNPDGNVHGLSGANSQGIDLCEEWTGTTRTNPPKSAESRLLWKWVCTEFAPDIALNLHAGLGWRGLADPPYDGAVLFALGTERLYGQPSRVALLRAVRDRLAFQTPGITDTGSSGIVLGEKFLDYHLSAEFGTVALLYHVNGGSVGPTSLWRRGADLFSAIARAALIDVAVR